MPGLPKGRGASFSSARPHEGASLPLARKGRERSPAPGRLNDYEPEAFEVTAIMPWLLALAGVAGETVRAQSPT